jgi:hypothetical protein
MRHLVYHSVLSLAIVAGGLALAGPASAVTWHNYKSGKCLSLKAPLKEGAALTIEDCAPLNSQSWNFYSDPARFGYFNLYNSMTFLPPYTRQLVGAAAAKMDQGTPLIVWRPTGELNQAWSMNLGPNDSAGHPCYWFGDAASPSVPMVMGVAAGLTTSGTPIIIWPLTFDRSNNYVIQPDQYWCQY